MQAADYAAACTAVANKAISFDVTFAATRQALNNLNPSPLVRKNRIKFDVVFLLKKIGAKKTATLNYNGTMSINLNDLFDCQV